jgi:phage terminase large subunit-like protein
MPHALCDRKGFEQVAGWVRDGWIRTTHGDVLDIEAVREELLGSEKMRELGKSSECLLGDCPGDIPRFEVTEAAYDPAQLTQFSGELAQAGMQMVEMRPLVLNFSPAMKELDELVTAKRLHHNGDPVLAWAISNVVCHRDAKDNIYPRKARADDKIDPAIALIMGIARMINQGEPTESVYDQRDVLMV